MNYNSRVRLVKSFLQCLGVGRSELLVRPSVLKGVVTSWSR